MRVGEAIGGRFPQGENQAVTVRMPREMAQRITTLQYKNSDVFSNESEPLELAIERVLVEAKPGKEEVSKWRESSIKGANKPYVRQLPGHQIERLNELVKVDFIFKNKSEAVRFAVEKQYGFEERRNG